MGSGGADRHTGGTRWWVTGLVVLAGGLDACSTEIGTACSSGADCPAEGQRQLWCWHGICTRTCLDGCPEGTLCGSAAGSEVCLPGCSASSTCPEGFRCTSEIRSQKRDHEFCAPEREYPILVGVGDACTSSKECSATLNCDRSWPGGYCTRGYGETLDSCGVDGLLVKIKSETYACYRACSSSLDCRPGYLCEPLITGGGICIPGGGDQLDTPCNTHDDCGLPFFCGEDKRCSRGCTSSLECGADGICINSCATYKEIRDLPASGSICLYGCVPWCSRDRDCGSDRLCQRFSEGTACGGLRDDLEDFCNDLPDGWACDFSHPCPDRDCGPDGKGDSCGQCDSDDLTCSSEGNCVPR